jgi:hypothetical protein
MRYRSQRSAWLETLRKIVQAIGPAIRSQALRDGDPSIDLAAVLFQRASCLPGDHLVFHNIHSFKRKKKEPKKKELRRLPRRLYSLPRVTIRVPSF